MFVLEDDHLIRFFTFLAFIPDADTCLNSACPRLAASSLPAGADLTRSPRIRNESPYSPTTLSLRPASLRQESLSPLQALATKASRTRREQAL